MSRACADTARVRGKISGTAACPRLDVFRSSKHIYAQLIDDVAGVTLASASSMDKDFEGFGGNIEAAKKVGNMIAKKAAEKGITKAVYDRGRLCVSRPRESFGGKAPVRAASSCKEDTNGKDRRIHHGAAGKGCCHQPCIQNREGRPRDEILCACRRG